MRKTCFRRVFSVFMVLSFMLTQSGGALMGVGPGEARAVVDISILSNLITSAQSLHDGAVEGTAVGNYDAGSKAVFQTAIDSAKSSRAYFNGSGDNTVIAPAIDNLNTAISVFQSKIVTADEADTDGDGALDTTDNCDLISNADQLDADNDGKGDACDNDDVTKPVITLIGESPIDVLLNSTYIDAGATASDDVNGNITGSIVTVNLVNTSIIGVYTVIYNVSDAANNAADQVIRTVNVVAEESEGDDDDNDGVPDDTDNCPVVANTDQINTDDDSSGDVCDTDDDNDEVSDAEDNCPLIGNSEQEDDNDNGIGDACEDTEAPVITLVGGNPVDVFVGDDYEDEGATALDNVDGDITAKVDNNSSSIDTSVAGTFIVTFNVSDVAGNPATPVTRTVNIIEQGDEEEDTVNPVITLLGSNPVSVYVGDDYDDAGATASDDVDGNLTENIETVSTINTDVAGTYSVTYDVSDAAGNEADQKTRTVYVVERQISGGGGSSTFVASKFVPVDAAIIINSGNEKTANRNVALALKAPSATMMAISNDKTFADSVWEVFAGSAEWLLTEGNGTKTVYTKFKNAAGTESAVYSDDIILGTTSDDSGQVLGDDTVGIYDGDLIQCKTSANANAVYIVKIVGNQKFIRQVKSDFFKYYTHLKWGDVVQVGSLDGYVLSRWVRVNTGLNGVAKPTDRVYEINGDWTKHWLNMTTQQFYARGGSEAAIFGINNGELGSYVTGPNVSVS